MNMNLDFLRFDFENDWWMLLVALGVMGIPFNLVNIFIRMDHKKRKNNRKK